MTMNIYITNKLHYINKIHNYLTLQKDIRKLNVCNIATTIPLDLVIDCENLIVYLTAALVHTVQRKKCRNLQEHNNK